MRKIILFELNEVPQGIIAYFTATHPRSAFARLLAHSRHYETYAEDSGILNPWVTWPSLHRGVHNDEHGIADFGEDLRAVNQTFPPIWDLLAKQGISTGVFGSFHSYPPPSEGDGRYAFHVPDVFAEGDECFPDSARKFQAFNLAMSQASGRNVAKGVAKKEAVDFLTHIPHLGIRPKTLLDTSRQVFSERFSPWKVTRRRSYQSLLSFDVYFKLLKQKKPDFSTFFTNHVAAAMHRYWAAAFPEDYNEIGVSNEWIKTYNQEIIFAMRKADGMLGRLMAFADRHGYAIWVASSMGQKANKSKHMDSQVFIVDKERFVKGLGLPADKLRFKVSMSPQYNLEVAADYQAEFKSMMSDFSINGIKLGFRQKGGFFSLDFYFNDLKDGDISVKIGNKNHSLQDLGLKNVKVRDRSSVTAYHIPEGGLYIYPSTGRLPASTQISTKDITPAILSNFGLNIPSYMNRARHL